MHSSAPHEHRPANGRDAPSKAGFWLVVVVVAAVLGSMLALFMAARGEHDAPESLDPVQLEAARQRWRDKAPGAYLLELQLSGSRGGGLTIEVGPGAAVTDRGGAAPGTAITRVEDLFDIIAADLKIVSDPTRVMPPGMAGTEREPLRATFDSGSGLPMAYDRPMLDDRPPLGWRVIRFEPR